ncbi:hypothetical protein [Ectobacillus sp. sgz5001026]|uniref:hypothetical protein n=1 Tax=Ectobacillus sp. sgz5001026 TaxID=3242473 RepID=UPI0036D30F63
MDMERTIYKKYALIGYDAKDVRTYIQSLLASEKEEYNLLKEKVQHEREENQRLLEELERKEQIPPMNPNAEEINGILMDLFANHTQSILDLKNELQEKEKQLVQQLKIKTQQREMSKNRIKEAPAYFKAMTEKSFEIEKELKDK